MSSEYPVIQVRGVSKSYHMYDQPHHRLWQSLFGHRKRFYREFWALRDISFEVRPGECVGIIGRNGSGKSTLLQVIAGTLAATGGDCEVRGRVAALLELGSGFNAEFTGRDNVYLNGALFGLDHAAVRRKFDQIEAFADIGSFIDQPVKTYSSGMKMRLAFAVQAQLEPDLLIVDEALSVGDGAFQIKCMNHMRGMLAKGTTVLFVSHSMQTVRMFCSRVIWLDRGELRLDGDTKEVTSRYNEMLYESGVSGGGAPRDKVSRDGGIAGIGHALIPLEEVDRSDTLRRWGSAEYRISSFLLRGGQSGFAKAYEFGEEMELLFEADSLSAFTGEGLSAAFAIRNKQGLDIISISTDRLGVPCGVPVTGEALRVRFTFAMRLVPGEYSLVLAMACQIDGARAYIDYVENAHYFSVVSDRNHCGVFEPEADAEFLGKAHTAGAQT